MKLEIKNLSKTYRKPFLKDDSVIALENVSFSVDQGSILALVGQNGAGKTTLIKSILNLISPDWGSISFDENITIKQLVKDGKVGYMPERLEFPDNLKLEEYLIDLMFLRGKTKNDYESRLNKLIKNLYLKPHINKKFSEYSKGSLKKVNFIQASLHNPIICILDEPTDGLDPVSRRALLNELQNMKRLGRIFIVSTHILSDLSLVADELVFLQKGKLIKNISLNEIDKSLDDWYLETILKSEGMI